MYVIHVFVVELPNVRPYFLFKVVIKHILRFGSKTLIRSTKEPILNTYVLSTTLFNEQLAGKLKVFLGNKIESRLLQ